MTTPQSPAAKKTPAKKTPAKKAAPKPTREIKSPGADELDNFVHDNDGKKAVRTPSAKKGDTVARLTLDLDEVDHATLKAISNGKRTTMAKWVRAALHDNAEFKKYSKIAEATLAMEDEDPDTEGE